MKRFRKLSQNAATRLDEPRLSVAPLIDVCFLLIVYFLVTTTIMRAEQDISTISPGTRMDQPRIPSPPVMVLVREDGRIVLNPGKNELLISNDPDERDLPELKEFLETVMVGVDELPLLLVKVDGKAEHQRVVDVLNVCSEIEWTRVGFLDEEW